SASSSWRYSSRCSPRRPASPRSKTGTGTKESPTTRIFMLRVSASSGIDPARLQIHGMPGARFHDHLEHRFGVKVVKPDRLADPPLHHDLGPEISEVAFGRVGHGRRGADHWTVVNAMAMAVAPVLKFVGSFVA